MPHCDHPIPCMNGWIGDGKELTPPPGCRIDFCSIDDLEDGMTVTYLMDTARQAGLSARSFRWRRLAGMAPLCWSGRSSAERRVQTLSLGEEWMVYEEFGQFLEASSTIWIEPAWKRCFPIKASCRSYGSCFDHPNLPASSTASGPDGALRVKKPLLGREGANARLQGPHGRLESQGDYGEEGFVYQQLAPPACFDGRHAVIGSWVVGQEETCLRYRHRESETPIVTNLSRFIPHVLI